MLFRFLAFGILLALLYRLLRNMLGPLLARMAGMGPDPGATRTPPSSELDDTKIQDADFRDLNN
ncbi:MAG: hypothetical protein QGI83_23530 [Candidatus Latescibacteria bacterium]|jgi:hypothetical protein|nr:hypothetical protein [Candidatus Latescibacterota bacterium]